MVESRPGRLMRLVEQHRPQQRGLAARLHRFARPASPLVQALPSAGTVLLTTHLLLSCWHLQAQACPAFATRLEPTSTRSVVALTDNWRKHLQVAGGLARQRRARSLRSHDAARNMTESSARRLILTSARSRPGHLYAHIRCPFRAPAEPPQGRWEHRPPCRPQTRRASGQRRGPRLVRLAGARCGPRGCHGLRAHVDCVSSRLSRLRNPRF